jgi:hypothetical protein
VGRGSEDLKIRIAADQIVIEDDGCGMNLADINDRFLYVGYDKRAVEGARSSSGRLFMEGRASASWPRRSYLTPTKSALRE